MNHTEKPTPNFIQSLRPIVPMIALLGLGFIILTVLVIFQAELKRFIFASPLDDFNKMQVSDGFHTVQLENGRRWNLKYEESHDTFITGIVRHTSLIRSIEFMILSHDILVTTGDFSNAELVSTQVTNHHFTWRTLTDATPVGTIHLLHTIPTDQAVYESLQSIDVGDQVSVKGWEILNIEGYDTNGISVGRWQDAGCNTILVTEVIIIN